MTAPTAPLLPQVRHDHYDDGDEHWITLDIDGVDVAWLTATDRGSDGVWIYCVYVHPKYRGHGLGRLLLQQAMDHYRGRSLSLAASPFEWPKNPADNGLDRPALHAWYARHGFSPSGPDSTLTRPHVATAAA